MNKTAYPEFELNNDKLSFKISIKFFKKNIYNSKCI